MASAASQHKSHLKLFGLKRKMKAIQVTSSDVSATIKLKSGKIQKREFYSGSSFLSQSSKFIPVNENISNITITETSGKVRVVNF